MNSKHYLPWVLIILLVCVALLVMSNANKETTENINQPMADTYNAMFLPKGDPDSGREAFIKLKCYVCHRVTNEGAMPLPIAEKPGPALSQPGYTRTRSQLAVAIVSPSHDIRRGFEEKEMLSQTSRMGDFSDTMTVRQLVDIVGYLLSQQELVKPEAVEN